MRAKATAIRRAVQLLFLTILLVVAAYWHWGFLPGDLKKIPIDAIRSATGFEADFQRVHYLPFRGIRIDQPVLKGKNGEELFRARSIRLATDLPAYLQDNRIVIQTIDVDSPVTQFRLNPAKPSASLAAAQAAANDAADAPVPLQNPVPHPFVVLEAIFDDSFLPSNVYLNELDIRHGRIIILPASGSGSDAPLETLREIRFSTQLDRRPLIPVEASFRTAFGRGDFKADGLVNLADGRHRISITGNVSQLPVWLAPALAAKGIAIPLLRGDLALDLNYDGVSLVTFKAASQKSHMDLRWGPRQAEGGFGIKLSGSYDFEKRKMIFSDGHFQATAVSAKNLSAHISDVRLATASVAWNPELIEIPRVQGTWNGTNFLVEGTIDRAESHATKLTFRQTLTRLDAWRPMAPKLFEHALNPGSLEGKIQIEATLSGKPSELTKNIRTLRVQIRDGSLKPKPLKTPVTNINGSLMIEDLRVFSAEDLYFRHAGEDYTLSGQFNNVHGGVGRLNLSTRKWDVGTRFRYFPDRLEFSTFTLESGLSHTGGSGGVTLGGEPVVDAEFRLHVVPERLAADWQTQWPWLKHLKLTGVIDGRGTLRGSLKRLNGLQVRLMATSPRLVYSNMVTFEPVEADVSLDSGVLEIIYAKAGFYGGEARATGRADLTNLKKPYFETHVFTQDTDLAKFCEKLDFIKNKFSGLMNLDVVLSGLMNNVKSLKGHGSFRVSQGELWQTELFKRLKKVAFLTIEGAENVVFNHADGSFTIADGAIQTDDCTLSSKLIDVHLKGRIGFDSVLALNIVSRFTSGLIREASEVGGLAPAIINIAQNKITRYLVTGTLKDPIYTAQN